MVSAFLDNDIKNIRKINNICSKFIKTQKISYLIEIINIFKMLENVLDISIAKEPILSYIEIDFKYKVRYIIDNLHNLDCRILRDNVDVFTKRKIN